MKCATNQIERWEKWWSEGLSNTEEEIEQIAEKMTTKSISFKWRNWWVEDSTDMEEEIEHIVEEIDAKPISFKKALVWVLVAHISVLGFVMMDKSFFKSRTQNIKPNLKPDNKMVIKKENKPVGPLSDAIVFKK